MFLAVIVAFEDHLALGGEDEETSHLAAPLFGQFPHRVGQLGALGLEGFIFGFERLEVGGIILFAFVEQFVDRFHPGIDLVDPGAGFFRQRRGRQPHRVHPELAARVPRVRRGDGRDPGKTGFGRKPFGFGFHRRRGELLGDLDIDPAIVGRLAEEVALDLAARGDIGVFADQEGDRVVPPH